MQRKRHKYKNNQIKNFVLDRANASLLHLAYDWRVAPAATTSPIQVGGIRGFLLLFKIPEMDIIAHIL